MLELLVIRHGHSGGDVENRHEGWADFPLTDQGREQARRMAARVVREFPPDRIYASPLQRAAAVARILQAATGVDLTFHEGLKEWNNGVLAGMPKAEALIKYPIPARRSLVEPIPGGESELQFRMRVEGAYHEIIERHKAGRVAIVAHGGGISMLFRAFLNLPVESDIWLASGDTAIHRWVIMPDRKRVLLANSTTHLDN